MIDHRHTVYIIDDDEAIRSALGLFMKAQSLAVKTYASANEFINVANDKTDGVLIVDVRMPGMNGLELQTYLCDKNIKLPIIFITGHGDVPMAVKAMRNGAIDFIEKPFDNNLLLERIYNCFHLLDRRDSYQNKYDKANDMLERLTKREREIMQLLAAGNVNKNIARLLNISIRTVEVHRVNIMKKLEAKSLADIVRISIENEMAASMPV